MFETLESFGITQGMVQIGIFVAILSYIIGMFYRYILIGGGILACVIVLLIPSHNTDAKKKDADKPIVESSVPPEYIEDCLRLTNNTKSGCVALWQERTLEESKL
jgi:hypothetical protein